MNPNARVFARAQRTHAYQNSTNHRLGPDWPGWLLYLIPYTSFLGLILMTAYLGGAVQTHFRVGEPWFFPVIIGVFAWLGYALRNPVIFRLLLGGSGSKP